MRCWIKHDWFYFYDHDGKCMVRKCGYCQVVQRI